MPSLIGPFSTQNEISYSRLSRQIDADLILTRIRDAVDNSDSSYLDYDRTYREYKAKREERRQKLISKGCIVETPDEKVQVKVKDNISRDPCCQGENNEDVLSQELEQWVKKMKCIDLKDSKYEQLGNIEVGVCEKEVIFGSQTHEPYPDLKRECFSYKGGKDERKRLHGNGCVEFAHDGSTMSGTWNNGRREGHFKIETNRKGVSYIEGEYSNDKMNGKVKIRFDDNTWLEGFFKDGVVHGFCRYFDSNNKLNFVGMHRDGKPIGTCWKIIRGGGSVVGRVDIEGKLSGTSIAYIYPDYKTALFGVFKDGIMACAQHCQVLNVITESGCIKVPRLTEPKGSLFKREISTNHFVTLSPTLRDPYESSIIEVKESDLPGAKDGIHAKRHITPNTVLAFYQGIKLPPNYEEEETWDANGYKIFDPSNIPEGTLDIKEEFRNTAQYSASLAHKTNHSFNPNSQFLVFDHPRWGVVPCIASTEDIAAGKEIFVRYGYDLDYCPDWYRESWESGFFKEGEHSTIDQNEE